MKYYKNCFDELMWAGNDGQIHVIGPSGCVKQGSDTLTVDVLDRLCERGLMSRVHPVCPEVRYFRNAAGTICGGNRQHVFVMYNDTLTKMPSDLSLTEILASDKWEEVVFQ